MKGRFFFLLFIDSGLLCFFTFAFDKILGTERLCICLVFWLPLGTQERVIHVSGGSLEAVMHSAGLLMGKMIEDPSAATYSNMSTSYVGRGPVGGMSGMGSMAGLGMPAGLGLGASAPVGSLAPGLISGHIFGGAVANAGVMGSLGAFGAMPHQQQAAAAAAAAAATTMVTLQIPDAVIGAIVGRGGAGIREITALR